MEKLSLRIDTEKNNSDMGNFTKIGLPLNFNLLSLQEKDFPSARIKIDELFFEWLNNDVTRRFIDTIFDEEVISSPLDELTSSESEYKIINPAVHKSIQEMRANSSQPPRSPTKKSPKKRTQAEMLNNRSGGVIKDSVNNNAVENIPSQEGDYSISARRPRSNFDSIPLFYHAGQNIRSNSRRIQEDQLSNRLGEIESFFKTYANGVPVEKFVHVTKRLCGIPSFFNLPLCKRLNSLYGDDLAASSKLKNSQTLSSSGTSVIKIKLNHFLQFWKSEIEPYDRHERFFRLVKQPEVDYISKDDFVPFLQELLHFHPGLDFLEAHEEFQRKYALTVIARIFYKVNLSRTGRITLKEIRRSNLVEEFMHVDEETDINRVTEYFSYEHFYVLYCRFFELDADKDSKLCREDLHKYGEHSLSDGLVDRVFSVGVRAFADGSEGSFRNTGMAYADFVYFMLAEEDKGNEASIAYWFTCCDLDGDGKLTPDEMRYFYRSQLHRLTSLGQEAVKFVDVLCQMVDMINPEDEFSITMKDLCKPDKIGHSGVLFDVLFNLHKFIRFETRDPFQEKQKREDIYGTDWNRFACVEYHRLAAEEEGYDNTNSGSMEVEDVESKYSSYAEDKSSRRRGGGGGNGDWFVDDEDDDDADGGGPVVRGGGGGRGR